MGGKKTSGKTEADSNKTTTAAELEADSGEKSDDKVADAGKNPTPDVIKEEPNTYQKLQDAKRRKKEASGNEDFKEAKKWKEEEEKVIAGISLKAEADEMRKSEL